MAQQQMAKEERSLGDLFSELASETGTLVRQEVSLAQAELTQKAATAGKNVGFLAVGGAVGYIGALAVTASIIMLLAQFMPAWLSALIVGVVVAVVSYFMISASLAALKKMDMIPRDTVETLREDAEWLKKEIT